MKTIIFYLALFLCPTVISGQITDNPYVASTNVDNTTIHSVEIKKNSTVVWMSYWKTRSDRYQSWVSFSTNTFIIDNDSYTYYRIRELKNEYRRLELGQKYSTKGKKGKVGGKNTSVWGFYLIFPSLPPGVENIDIVEEIENGFEWKGIRINNPDNSKTSSWTERSIKKDWKINGIDAIEGIYENTAPNQSGEKLTIAIKRNKDNYEAIFLKGYYNSKWNVGDIKAFITKTASPNIFKTTWYMEDKSAVDDVYTSFEKGLMKQTWTDREDESIYLKLYPTTSSSNFPSTENVNSTGTGFAISNEGYIATNYHVVNGAKNITVRGVNGNFNEAYNANVIVKDKNNDLAIIKVETQLGNIPYSFDFKPKSTGESVFALGYPLLSSMGDEIKLTNGIISSRSGFQGDITSYQTSVPAQPGNSGGPLFDNSGSIIGIINSKHNHADNATYSIKANYLNNLIQALDTELYLNRQSSKLSNLNLGNQVKKIKNFVYIIEIK